MKQNTWLVCLIAVFILTIIAANSSEYRDLYEDTWVGTDALGRTMPTHEDVGPPKQDHDRVVGMFFITWHGDHLANQSGPYQSDVTKILSASPEARLDAQHPLWVPNLAGAYHWAEPEMGYFLSKDRWVIRRELSMLSDAGVDMIILDVTNGVSYWDEWEVLFDEMHKMKEEGNKVPQFCFWAFNGPAITVVMGLYDRIYKTRQYPDMWFYWMGKPLILCNGKPSVDATTPNRVNPNPRYDPEACTDPEHPHYNDPLYCEEYLTDYPQEIKDFFTMRTMWWGYYEWAGERFVGTEGNWSFGYDLSHPPVANMDPADLVSPYQGIPEQAAVTAAQHPTSIVGKSWSRAHGQPALNEYDLPVPTFVPWLGETVETPEGYGIYFQERWDEALAADPRFIYLNDWNEWTAGKYDNPHPFLGRNSDFFFVDQYNSEFNRCIHPMKGGYTDNYYMQMAQNIRRYKGARPIPVLVGLSSITIDGDFADWQTISTEYRDTAGDTIDRDYPGYAGLHYHDSSGRNDILTSKVAVDHEKIHFYVETNQPLSPHTDPNWMLLLIDSDQNHETGWHGYDFLVNRQIDSATWTSLMAYRDESWVEIGKLNFHYSDNQMEISIPREALGLTGEEIGFDFKWSDNPAELADPISFCTHGDTAPNRRFNYRVQWRQR